LVERSTCVTSFGEGFYYAKHRSYQGVAAGTGRGRRRGVLSTASAQDKKDKDKKPAAAVTAVFELYVDSADEFRFRLKDAEGVLLATSGKGYRTKADCQNVIDTIKSTAGKAKVEELQKK
jgi:uncharacterized protein YegP (UPF0339 family)